MKFLLEVFPNPACAAAYTYKKISAFPVQVAVVMTTIPVFHLNT
jgi:hypothetical protein